MRESLTYGSARGALSNERVYLDFRARVSMVQGKSVHSSAQECLWFRARMSVVQDKSVHRSGKEGQNPDNYKSVCTQP
jgi:hypothetical protein